MITAARKVPNARKDALAWIVRMDDDAIYKFRSPQSVELGKIRLAETNHLRLRLDTVAWKTTNAPALDPLSPGSRPLRRPPASGCEKSVCGV